MQIENGSETSENKQPLPPPTQQAVTAAEANVVPLVSQQPWVAMQYRAAAMVMQQSPRYIPYHPHLLHHHPPQQLQQNQHQGGGSNYENRTIWVGDLHNWMDEDYLGSCFASTNEVDFSLL
ncbi:hypothetical protein HAX54_038422 [Datura stramonium]|uniref:Uncharacterized protein n=1 Tax=Datura stramonium TaxID=4076 RepID=A0ABS8Y887_DATST|nr:hypothetical protein [Datura stramonium]